MKLIRLKRRAFLQKTGEAITLAGIGETLSSLSAAAQQAPAAQAKALEVLDGVYRDTESVGTGFLCIPRKEGEFLRLLVQVTRAQHILELGTSVGTAAIWMSLGLEKTGGHLTTIEILEERAQLAKENVTKAGLAHRVTFKQGDAHQIVPTLKGPFDFVLLAADKSGNTDYFNKLYPAKLARGGLLLAANAISQKEKLAEYLDLVNKNPEFETVVVSMTAYDGYALSFRKSK